MSHPASRCAALARAAALILVCLLYAARATGGPILPPGEYIPDGEPRVDIYAAVENPTTYLERAAGLGGTIAMPAMKVDEETEIAMFTDPQGGTFGLYSG